MTLEERMKSGALYYEFGNDSEEDKVYEKVIDQQRIRGKDLQFEYNNTIPSDMKRKNEILKELLGDVGKEVWIEAPAHFSYGCNTHIGDHFYSNYNLVVVDDTDVYIGNHVMIAPNVTISATGHPVDAEIRRKGTQFSVPVVIGDDVWIGANAVILPGVHIGDRAVIGAGSVVTHDIPSDTVAVGCPCKVLREITEEDKIYYFKGRKIDDEFHL